MAYVLDDPNPFEDKEIINVTHEEFIEEIKEADEERLDAFLDEYDIDTSNMSVEEKRAKLLELEEENKKDA